MNGAVVSLFSGGGGLDLGLAMAGFDTRVAVEWERYACRTLRENRDRRMRLSNGHVYLDGCEVIESDVRSVSSEQILHAGRLQPGEATLLAGGPPCVTFSVAGRREGLTSETGRLFEEYVRVLKAVRPVGLVYENVKGLLTAVGSDGTPGGAFTEIRHAIESAGYTISWRLVNAADYGVPQQRERVIILGLRGDQDPGFPEPTHHDSSVIGFGRQPWLTVGDVIRDLPPAVPYGSEPEVANHVARRHSADVVESFARTPPGKRNDRFKRDRLRWDRPSKVIRAQGKPKADGSGQKNSSHQALHPEAHRQLTPRECARIQTFPDWYWLPKTFVNSYRILGDAVPPTLGQILGEHMAAAVADSSPHALAA